MYYWVIEVLTSSDEIYLLLFEIGTDVIKQSDRFVFSMCNPPFHDSKDDVRALAQRKWKNLIGNSKQSSREKSVFDQELNSSKVKSLPKDMLNFRGKHCELTTAGGEVAFISKMIEESYQVRENVIYFTCLVSQADHLPKIYNILNSIYDIKEVYSVNMAQGNKKGRFIAWSYFTESSMHDKVVEFLNSY